MDVTYFTPTDSRSLDDADGGGYGAVVTGLLPGEPVFVFRARDLLAGVAIEAWYARARVNFTPARAEQAKAAAQALYAWQDAHQLGTHMPD